MRTVCAVAAMVALMVLGVGAAHPCDTQPSGPWAVRTGKAPVIGWCEAGPHDGFIVSIDGALTDISKPAPAVAGEGTYGVYYAVLWPGGVTKGTHIFGVRAYTAGGGMQSQQSVLVFTR